MTRYTSKEMAELVSVSIPTLRYYERIGLLDRVRRETNGHRRYGEKDVLRVQFLKRLRATGMSIREMQHYVDLFRAGDDTLVERIDMLEAHRAEVLEQMKELQATVDLLDMKIDRYQKQVAARDSLVATK